MEITETAKPMSRAEYVEMLGDIHRNHVEMMKATLLPALKDLLASVQPKEEVISTQEAQAQAAAQIENRFKHYRAMFAGTAMRVLMQDKELPDEQIVQEAFELADMMAAEANK